MEIPHATIDVLSRLHKVAPNELTRLYERMNWLDDSVEPDRWVRCVDDLLQGDYEAIVEQYDLSRAACREMIGKYTVDTVQMLHNLLDNLGVDTYLEDNEDE